MNIIYKDINSRLILNTDFDLKIRILSFYSYFKASTGFFDAALQLCKLTVSNATKHAITGPAINVQYGIGHLK